MNDNYSTTDGHGQPITLSGYDLGILSQAQSTYIGLYLAPHRRSRIGSANALVAKGLLCQGACRQAPARYTLTSEGKRVWEAFRRDSPKAWAYVSDLWRLSWCA